MSRREGAGSRFCDYLTVDCADLPTQNSRDLTSVGLTDLNDFYSSPFYRVSHPIIHRGLSA